MLIDQLNLNQLRVFERVFRSRSMTVAAKDLHLTQSGVSQHIRSLESTLGITLFDRVATRIVPTTAAQTLYKICSTGFDQLEKTLRQVSGREKEIAGDISVGMPPEFGNTVIVPLLARFLKQHPEVTVTLKPGLTSAMSSLVMEGDVDFAFIDSFAPDPRFRVEKVFEQTLELCALTELVKKWGRPSHRKQYYESMDLIGYLEAEPILRVWFTHHLPQEKLTLNVRAYAVEPQTVARLMIEGIGAAVLPGNVVEDLRRSGHKVHVFTGSPKPVKHTIALVSLRGRTQSHAAWTLREFLKTSLAA